MAMVTAQAWRTVAIWDIRISGENITLRSQFCASGSLMLSIPISQTLGTSRMFFNSADSVWEVVSHREYDDWWGYAEGFYVV